MEQHFTQLRSQLELLKTWQLKQRKTLLYVFEISNNSLLQLTRATFLYQSETTQFYFITILNNNNNLYYYPALLTIKLQPWKY